MYCMPSLLTSNFLALSILSLPAVTASSVGVCISVFGEASGNGVYYTLCRNPW